MAHPDFDPNDFDALEPTTVVRYEPHNAPSPAGPFGATWAPPTLTELGSTLAGFRLLTELGIGGLGRVLLTTETDLADRPTVVKLVPFGGDEHLSLARLQHTHIVPLYGVRDEPLLHLHLLCMPYFGSVTLARLLEPLADIPAEQRTGRDLLAALDRLQSATPGPPPPLAASAPGRLFLERASYVQAICWIGSCLAEALHYAHQRGLVHLDVKPSNVLLAADGQPMLLDFHLARSPVGLEGPAPSRMGGTLPYMPREQQLAVLAVRKGRPVPAAVDGRADVFALGAVLYQALGGSVPHLPGVSPSLDRLNARVSPGLADAIGKCLAPAPDGRYADAAALAADLRRHLADRPLLGVRNRLSERWAKWRRRQPHALAIALAFLVTIGLALGGGLAGWYAYQQRHEQPLVRARAQLALARDQLGHDRLDEAVDHLRIGLELASTLPGEGGLVRDLAAELDRAQRQLAQRELHRLADDLRGLFPFTGQPAAVLQDRANACRTIWAKRQTIREKLGPAVPGEGWAADLLDVAILGGELRVLTVGPAGAASARAAALRQLDEARGLCGASAALESARLRLGAAPSELPTPAPRSAWECCAVGRSFLLAHDLPRAEAALREALARDPAGLWPNFVWGQLAYQQKHYDEAERAFSVCIGAAPRAWECYFNRARAEVGRGQYDLAANDLGQAIQFRPDLAAPYLARARLHLSRNQADSVDADIIKASERGADQAEVHYLRALLALLHHDRPTALQFARSALALDPGKAEAAALCERLERGR